MNTYKKSAKKWEIMNDLWISWNCKPKGNYGNFITKMHYVGFFIVFINHNGEVDVISAQALH
jgi:hypothetical protein